MSSPLSPLFSSHRPRRHFVPIVVGVLSWGTPMSIQRMIMALGSGWREGESGGCLFMVSQHLSIETWNCHPSRTTKLQVGIMGTSSAYSSSTSHWDVFTEASEKDYNFANLKWSIKILEEYVRICTTRPHTHWGNPQKNQKNSQSTDVIFPFWQYFLLQWVGMPFEGLEWQWLDRSWWVGLYSFGLQRRRLYAAGKPHVL